MALALHVEDDASGNLITEIQTGQLVDIAITGFGTSSNGKVTMSASNGSIEVIYTEVNSDKVYLPSVLKFTRPCRINVLGQNLTTGETSTFSMLVVGVN